MMAIKVNGTTKPITTAPKSQITLPPSNQADTPDRKLKIANEACITVARL
jgi:hypothetical protein